MPARPDLEGHSLAPQLRNAAAPRAWPAITTHNPGNHAVRTKDWRYIRYADGSEELYDLAADPEELTNLVTRPDQQATLKRLRQTTLAELRRSEANFLELLPPFEPKDAKNAKNAKNAK